MEEVNLLQELRLEEAKLSEELDAQCLAVVAFPIEEKELRKLSMTQESLDALQVKIRNMIPRA